MLFSVFHFKVVDLDQGFEKTLQLIQTASPVLWAITQKRYLIFDRGNNNRPNIEEVDRLCQKWGAYFLAGIRASMVKAELKVLEIAELPEIYAYGKTTLFGKTITKPLYGKDRQVLLYVNMHLHL